MLLVLTFSVESDPFVTLWTVACQAPLTVEFSQQEYWKRLPFPIAGNLLDPGIETLSFESPALAGGFFTTVPLGSLLFMVIVIQLLIHTFVKIHGFIH